MKFNKENMDRIHKEINAALKVIAANNGISLTTGSLGYTPTTQTFSVSVKGSTGNTDELLWDKHCYYYGLEPHHFNVVIKIRNEEYEIIGINPRARKRPINIKNVKTGVEFNMTATHCVAALKDQGKWE